MVKNLLTPSNRHTLGAGIVYPPRHEEADEPCELASELEFGHSAGLGLCLTLQGVREAVHAAFAQSAAEIAAVA